MVLKVSGLHANGVEKLRRSGEFHRRVVDRSILMETKVDEPEALTSKNKACDQEN